MTNQLSPSYRPLPVAQLKPNSYNPNQMSDEAFDQYAAEVKHLGRIPKPIVVRAQGEGHEIVDGEHGWRAAKEAGLTEVLCEVIDCDDFEARRQTFKRNQGGGDHPLKLARMFKQMMIDRSLSGRKLAKIINVAEGTVRNALVYLEAWELRKPYAVELGKITPTAEADAEAEITQLTIEEVRTYVDLPAEIRDAWLNAGASIKAVKRYLDDGENRQSILARIVESGLYKFLRSFPGDFAPSLVRAEKILQWLDTYPALKDAREYALIAAEFDFGAEILSDLPLKRKGGGIQVLISPEDWRDVVRRCDLLELNKRELRSMVRSLVMEKLDAAGVPVDSNYLDGNDLTLALSNAPDDIRNAEYLTSEERSQLADYSPDVPPDLLVEAKRRTCAEFARCRQPGESGLSLGVSRVCSDILNLLREERRLQSFRASLDQPEVARQSVLAALSATEPIKNGTVRGRPATVVLEEHLAQLDVAALAIMAALLRPVVVPIAAELWLHAAGGEMPTPASPAAA